MTVGAPTTTTPAAAEAAEKTVERRRRCFAVRASATQLGDVMESDDGRALAVLTHAVPVANHWVLWQPQLAAAEEIEKAALCVAVDVLCETLDPRPIFPPTVSSRLGLTRHESLTSPPAMAEGCR